MVIVFNLVQLKKAEESIIFRLGGRLTIWMFSYEKICFPITSMLSGMLIIVKLSIFKLPFNSFS